VILEARALTMKSETAKFARRVFVLIAAAVLLRIVADGNLLLVKKKEIRDGPDRLVLYYERTSSIFSRFNEQRFKRLVWEKRSGIGWASRSLIEREPFQQSHPKYRWIDDVETFDPVKGIAILKIAEEAAAPITNRFNRVHLPMEYSWREWDLNSGKEIRRLRVCADPFEVFTPDVEGGGGAIGR
jgi:hypothetical protein